MKKYFDPEILFSITTGVKKTSSFFVQAIFTFSPSKVHHKTNLGSESKYEIFMFLEMLTEF